MFYLKCNFICNMEFSRFSNESLLVPCSVLKQNLFRSRTKRSSVASRGSCFFLPMTRDVGPHPSLSKFDICAPMHIWVCHACSTDTVISTRGLSDTVGAEKTGLKKQKHSRLGLNGVLGQSFCLLTPSSPSLPKPHHHPGWRYLRQGHRPGDVRGAWNALRLHRSHGNDAPQRTQW